jgi:predicted O-methyltransferase YrrM
MGLAKLRHADALPVEPWWQGFPVRAWLTALPFLPRIPAASLDHLLPGSRDLTIEMRHASEDRALGYGEAYVLSLITAWLKPNRVFEIGTASGQGTVLIARQAPDAHIDSLDLGNEQPSLGTQRGQPPWQDVASIGRAYRQAGRERQVTQHFADSARFDYSPYAGKIDLAFIDGAHTFDYVRSDSRHALEMVRPGGVVVWDDCTYASPGVARALLSLRREGVPIHRVTGTRLAMTPGTPG